MPSPTRCSYVGIFLSSLLLIACGGRTITKKGAQGLIADSPIGAFDKESAYVESVNQTGQRDALIEVRLKAAFRFEKVQGKWLIREVRLGNRPWEKLDDILRALEMVKRWNTERALEKVAAAIQQYCLKRGALPRFKDYVELSDQLNPDYLDPLIRLDAWQSPLAAYPAGTDAIRLVSAGPDGKVGSADDIELTRSCARQ